MMNPEMGDLPDEAYDLFDERDKYKKALEDIDSHVKGGNVEVCFYHLQEIARNALKEESE